MALFTPNGLKIRLDPNGVDQVIKELRLHHDLNDILLDVELWEDFPERLAVFAASLAAVITQSFWVIMFSVLSVYVLGTIIRDIAYSDCLRRIFPMALGHPVISFAYTVGTCIYLGFQGAYIPAVGLMIIYFVAHWGFLGLVYMGFTKIRVPFRKLFNLPPTHQEFVFITICNKRAAKYGLSLNWDDYDVSNEYDMMIYQNILKCQQNPPPN
jgi:hypothetical protein